MNGKGARNRREGREWSRTLSGNMAGTWVSSLAGWALTGEWWVH